jgi:hypothetical protein
MVSDWVAGPLVGAGVTVEVGIGEGVAEGDGVATALEQAAANMPITSRAAKSRDFRVGAMVPRSVPMTCPLYDVVEGVRSAIRPNTSEMRKFQKCFQIVQGRIADLRI